MLDPPRHTEFRELFSRGYTPRRVAGIESAVRGFVRARLDAIAELGECDIVAELFQPVPGFVVAGYLGVPEADRARFGGWTQGIVGAGTGASPSVAATAAELFGYFTDLIERRRTEPGEDTISDLVRLMDGDSTGALRILGFAFTMITGGNDTATGLLSGAAELLTANLAQRQLLLDRPGLLPAAIEELLRLTSPVQGLARTLTRDTTVRERVIPRGRKALLLYGSANRDPACSVPTPMNSTSCAASRPGHGTWLSPSARTTAWELPRPGCRPVSSCLNCSPAFPASPLTRRQAPSPPGITPAATPPCPLLPATEHSRAERAARGDRPCYAVIHSG
jgi:hypothetical protein